MTTQIESSVNGLDLQALGKLVEEIKNDTAKGFARFKVRAPDLGGLFPARKGASRGKTGAPD